MRKVKDWLCSVVCLLLLSAQTHAIENLDDQPLAVIALFGDSIITGVQFSTGFTAFNGNGLEFFGCPPIYLRNILRNEGSRPVDLGPPPVPCSTTTLVTPVRDRIEQENTFRNARVLNWGEGGTTTVAGVGRIQRDLTATTNQFPVADQRFTLIHYGTNDLGVGISSAQTSFNLTQIVSAARALGYTPALSTLLPRSAFDTSGLNAVINSLESQLNVPVVDMFTAFLTWPGSPDPLIPLLGPAGQQGGATSLLPIEVFSIGGGVTVTTRLHPNDQGYLLMAERWVEEFLEDAIPGARQVVIAPIIDLILQ